jgi:hypothetical protein
MNITYLKELEQNSKLTHFTNKGLPIDAIIELETKYNNSNPFPTAIREFLFLAGEDNTIGFDTHHSIDILQQRAKENLEYCKQKIDRPFFAFDQLVDCEQFTFVYLDEDQNDPDVYLAEPYAALEEGDPLVRRYKKYTFSSLVNEHIRRIKNDLPLD